MTPVVVLDAEQRAALAVTRSLTRQGLQPMVASSISMPLAAASQGVGKVLRYVPPESSIHLFAKWAADWAISEPTGLLLGITDATNTAFSSAFASNSLAGNLGVDPSSYRKLTDKSRLFESSSRLSVPAPKTELVTDIDSALAAAVDMTYPVIIKPALSRVRVNDRIVPTSVRLASGSDDVRKSLENCPWFPDVPVLVQQFIPGHGAGVFCLYDRDHAVAWFAHRRIREKPPSGGVSVLCESASVDPVLQRYAESLLRDAAYRGVAMVEFRIGADGRPYLMEVNARFWGSLQLAIDSGVDFPWLYYRMLMGDEVAPVKGYEVGRRLRWFLGDLDNLILQLRDPRRSLSARLGALSAFLGTGFDSRCRQEVLRWSDPRPGWLELRQWLASVTGRRP